MMTSSPPSWSCKLSSLVHRYLVIEDTKNNQKKKTLIITVLSSNILHVCKKTFNSVHGSKIPRPALPGTSSDSQMQKNNENKYL